MCKLKYYNFNKFLNKSGVCLVRHTPQFMKNK